MNALTNMVRSLDQNSFALILGVAVLITLVALGQALLPEDLTGSRLKSHLRRRENLRSDRLQVRQRIAICDC